MTQDKRWLKLTKFIMLTAIGAGLAICIAMFVILGVVMNAKSTAALNGMGEITMTGVGKQYALRYDAVIEQRITMVEGLYKTYPDDGADDKLATAAEACEFNYLAYMDVDGNLEMIYGAQLTVNAADKEAFKTSLITEKKNRVAVASDADGESFVMLIAVPTTDGAYALKGGGKSVALVAGLKNTLINEMLAEKNSDGSNAQRFDAHIIRISDGSYVMNPHLEGHNHDTGANYFDYVKNFGLGKNEETALIQAMQDRMSQGKVYSAVINSSPRQHIYCERLNDSDWYLVTVMNYTDLDAIVNGLSKNWTGVTILTCAVILVVMLVIFGAYFFINRRNLKQLEKARVTAEEANKAKSDFLSNMSHDIRTPMNAIVGMTAIAIANIDNNQQVSDCLKKISLSSRHLLGLINDVLDMSKIESGKMTLNMEQISLNEIIEGISTIMQPQIRTKRQKFDIYVRDIQSENVYCDSVRLNQVLLNLLSNACKFTPEEGKIELTVYQENSPLGKDFIRTHLIVQDNGIGMSEEFQKHVFDSFTREDRTRVNKTEGTGLGMSITKYIIDSMRGTITLKSKKGEGTTFHVTIDLEKAQIDEVDMVLPEWHMLVVDDDQMLRDTTVASLATIGVKADSAIDGETAIKMAVGANDTQDRYDVILMDWKLPGIDGIETARRLRKKLGKDIPIMLISAYDWTEIEDEARGAGVNGFIAKPLFKSTLFHGLRKFADGGASAAAEEDSKPVDLTGRRILVAEDNDLNWEIAKLLLESVGLVVEHAENGQVCLDKLLASKPGTYDAILMDVRMPVMDGLEATRFIRTLKRGYNKIPVIAMTADAFSEDVKKCLECGMNAHIAKPIDIDVIQATLRKFIK